MRFCTAMTVWTSSSWNQQTIPMELRRVHSRLSRQISLDFSLNIPALWEAGPKFTRYKSQSLAQSSSPR
jgi:hypothetical protein